MGTHDETSRRYLSLVIESIKIPLLIIIWLLGASMYVLSRPIVIHILYPMMSPPDRIGWSSTEQLKRVDNVMMYLDGHGTLELTLPENQHMADVRSLLRRVEEYTVFLTIFFFLLIAFFREKITLQYLVKLFKNTILLYLILGSLFLFSGILFWGTFFDTFHELLFSSGTWSFPASSTLIRLFPEIFWQKMFFILFTFPLLKLVFLWYFIEKIQHLKISHSN